MVLCVTIIPFVVVVFCFLLYLFFDTPKFQSFCFKTMNSADLEVVETTMTICGFKKQSGTICCSLDKMIACKNASIPNDPMHFVFVDIENVGFFTLHEPMFYNEKSILKQVPVIVNYIFDHKNILTAVTLKYDTEIKGKNGNIIRERKERGICLRSGSPQIPHVFF